MRLPAGNLEILVIDRLRAFLIDPVAVLDAVDEESQNRSGQPQLHERSRHVAEELGTHDPNEVRAMLVTLLSRLEVKPDRIDIHVSRDRLAALLSGKSIDVTMQDQSIDHELVTLAVPARLKRVGREVRSW
jgi:hypothetical protein